MIEMDDKTHIASERPTVRVLVVDDDPDIRDLIAQVGTRAGFEVMLFSNGEDVLDHIGNEITNPPSQAIKEVLLLDDHMPGFRGGHILASLRHAKWFGPIILMTAFDDLSQTEARRLGATAFFRKPFDVTRIVRKVEEVLTGG